MAEEAQAAAAASPAADDLKAKAFLLVRESKFQEALEILSGDKHLWRQTDEEGHTLLHWAALSGSADFVSKALDAGCAVDAAASNGQTALMWAAIRGQVRAARLLLDARADALSADSLGATPLILSIQHQQQASFLLLMAAESTREKLLKARDKSGCGPVHWAAYKGCLNSLKLLNYFDADFAALDELNMTPLHRAVTARAVSVFEFLIDHGVDPSARDNQGRNCLDLAGDQADPASRSALLRLLEMQSPPQVEGVTMEGQQGRGLELRRKPKKDPATDLRQKFVHNAAATFWIVSVSLAVFQYLTEIREISWELAPNVALVFELGVPASLALFLITVQLDPGKVPARFKGASGVEELLRSLEASGEGDVDRLCLTTWVLKGPRTKFCTRTDACVREFDHFCGWLNVAIGGGNHRPFIFLSCVEPVAQFSHLYLCWTAASTLVSTSSGGFGTWLYGVAAGYPLLVLLVCLHGMTAPMVMCLAINQLRLITVNLTTNEMINAYRYGHFWHVVVQDGVRRKVFKNPFHKGNFVKNCLDFWWTRRREDRGPSPVSVAELTVREKLRASRSNKVGSELAV